MTEQQQIQKGFNQGYLIAQHKPELYKTLSNSLKKVTPNLYAKSFISGGKQYEIDKKKEKLKPKSKESKQKKVSKQPTKPPTRGR